MNKKEKLNEIIHSCEWLMKEDEIRQFENALATPPPVSIRLNPFKKVPAPPSEKPVPWCEYGYYLEQRPVFTLDPLFHAGCYYVQEASSMFLHHLLQQILPEKKRWKALDLCAAPGGKSTLTASLLPEESILVSNEIIPSRANILHENMQKWGLTNSIITSLNPSVIGRQLANYFDLIIIDAPCSGEGLIRKDPEAINEWSQSNVSNCIVRQKQILSDAWNALAPGGILIYSTCTFNKKEDEEQVHLLMTEFNAVPVNMPVPPEWNIRLTETEGATSFRFFPHLTKGEGFFISAVRKPDEFSNYLHHQKNRKLNPEPVPKKESAELGKYLRSDREYILSKKENEYFFHPAEIIKDVQFICQQLPVLYNGHSLGSVKGKDFIPSPSLALSVALNKDLFPVIELDLHTALLFLKKEEIRPAAAEGWNLVTHENIPLGWIKRIGNRCNNYFPKEWRIRMSIP